MSCHEDLYTLDEKRYGTYKMSGFHKYWRLTNTGGVLRPWYGVLFLLERYFRNMDWGLKLDIGPGLYMGHVYGITLNPKVKIGKNCNIHKGVTIGQENRGKRKGVPVIGDEVWIGINATIVGNVHIGNDVLIAPGAYINFLDDNSLSKIAIKASFMEFIFRGVAYFSFYDIMLGLFPIVIAIIIKCGVDILLSVRQ